MTPNTLSQKQVANKGLIIRKQNFPMISQGYHMNEGQCNELEPVKFDTCVSDQPEVTHGIVEGYFVLVKHPMPGA